MLLCEGCEECEVVNELLEECDYLSVLGAASCFTRRDLNRVLGYFEATVPQYSLSEFQSHFTLTCGAFEQLCREVINTGQIPLSNRGRECIPPEKQVLIFIWTMANQEVSRLVADRFNITLSNMHRVLKRSALGFTDLCATYIKWPDGKLVIFYKRMMDILINELRKYHFCD